jgi:hypothetical protein
MAPLITTTDLVPFADIERHKAEAMITDAIATANLHAPGITKLDEELKRDAAKAILRGAILRWHAAGDGGVTTQQQTSGPYTETVTVDPRRTGMFYPSEIEHLRKLVKPPAKAFSFDLSPAQTRIHGVTCSHRFGSGTCDCGANIAGRPIFGPDR